MSEWNQEEKWDHSWPYNFAWGVSSEGKVHVWRIQGHHDQRKELEKEWERPPHVGSGDTLGQAQYIPAELKLDGDVVAPPEIQVQVFYGGELPKALVDWFEHRFTGAVVREAHKRDKPTPQKEAKRIEWEQKDDKIVIDALHSVTPKELSEYKRDLAKQFPDAQIVAPEYGDDPRHDAFDPDYHDEDIRLKGDDHTASAKWAQEHLSGIAAKAPEIDSKPLQDKRWISLPASVANVLERLTGR